MKSSLRRNLTAFLVKAICIVFLSDLIRNAYGFQFSKYNYNFGRLRANRITENRLNLRPNSNIQPNSNRNSENNFELKLSNENEISDKKNSDLSHFEKHKSIYTAALGILGIFVFGYIISHATNGFNINTILQNSIHKIESLGPYGYLYFAAVYIAAEVLAIPAFPLTASSGYLFGLIPGTATVIISATIASCISFFIGRTLLRNWAKKIADGNSKWRALDSVIGKEGFKVVLLLRLSPLLPFAISNYLYGVTAVDFWSFLTASFLGFIPGTLGIVYAGTAGKSILQSAGQGGLPWYAYVVVTGVIILAVKTIGKIASDAITEMEKEDEIEKNLKNVTEKF